MSRVALLQSIMPSIRSSPTFFTLSSERIPIQFIWHSTKRRATSCSWSLISALSRVGTIIIAQVSINLSRTVQIIVQIPGLSLMGWRTILVPDSEATLVSPRSTAIMIIFMVTLSPFVFSIRRSRWCSGRMPPRRKVWWWWSRDWNTNSGLTVNVVAIHQTWRLSCLLWVWFDYFALRWRGRRRRYHHAETMCKWYLGFLTVIYRYRISHWYRKMVRL